MKDNAQKRCELCCPVYVIIKFRSAGIENPVEQDGSFFAIQWTKAKIFNWILKAPPLNRFYFHYLILIWLCYFRIFYQFHEYIYSNISKIHSGKKFEKFDA